MSHSPFEVLVAQPLWAGVVNQIRNGIVSGTLPEGSRLPSERQLCTEMGVSRVSLREAFRVLQAGGYLETRAGAGTFVRIPEKNSTNWVEQDIQVVQLFELRMLLEPGAAGLSAKRRTSEALTAMQAEVDALHKAGEEGDLNAALEADLRFHQLIGDSAANPPLTQLMRQMQELCGVERRASLHVPGQIQRAAVGHQQILDAITSGDAAASGAAMTQHLQDAVVLVTDYSHDMHFANPLSDHESDVTDEH